MARAYSKGFDALTHLDFPAFDGDREAVRSRALAAGVMGWAVAGADPTQWDRLEEIVSRHGGLALLGVHPWWAADLDPSALSPFLEDLARRPLAHGLGECGLDHHRSRDPASRARQRHAFRAQLALARERDVPVVIHCVRAFGPLLRLCAADGLPAAGGVIHGWSGPPDLVAEALGLGLHLSFGPQILRDRARRARASLAAVPADRLLLETDCPDQAPPGIPRGEPAHLREVAREAAAIRDTRPETLWSITGDNARRLFRA